MHDNSNSALPAVLGYDVPGGGTVFFTAFHGVTQQSRKIKELIRFLILRPIMNGDLRTARLTLTGSPNSECLEFVGVLGKSAMFGDHTIPGEGVRRVALSWKGAAKLRLELRDRNGLLRAAAESSSSPLAATGYLSAGGYVRVCVIDISADQIPYCVLMNKTVD